MKLTVVIPANNEEDSLPPIIRGLVTTLESALIDHEVLVVNDNSSDGTEKVLQELSARFPSVRYVNNYPPNGFAVPCRREDLPCGLIAGGGSPSPRQPASRDGDRSKHCVM